MTNQFIQSQLTARDLARQRLEQQQLSQQAAIEQQISRLPSWARDRARRKLLGIPDPSVPERALITGLGLISKGIDLAGKAPAPAQLIPATQVWGKPATLKGVYETSDVPFKPVREQAEPVLRKGGAPGRVAASVVDIAARPETVVGAFTGGSSLAANVLGRGSLSVPRYAIMTAGAGAGAGAGQEMFGTPGAILGGLGGGWAGLARMNPRSLSAIRQAGETGAETGRKLELMAENTSEALRQGRYKKAVLEDGTPVDVITRKDLTDQIRARQGRIYALENNPMSPDKGDLDTIKENTDNLQALLEYMNATGREEFLLRDHYDAAAKLGRYNSNIAVRDEMFVRAAEGSKRVQAIKEALQSVPGFDMRETGEGTMRELFRTDVPPEVEASLAQLKGLQEQLKESESTLKRATQGLTQAKTQRSQTMKSLLASMPSGSRTAAREYLSALLGGDEARIAEAATKLQRRGVNLESLETNFGFDEAAGLHSMVGEAESSIAQLRQSHEGLRQTFLETRRANEGLISGVYSTAANNLSRKMLRPAGSQYFYRPTSLANDGGELAVVLERVKPASSSALDVIEKGAMQEADAMPRIAQAQAQLEELLAARQAARKTGASREELSAMRQQIDEARAQVKRLQEPARPLPANSLPAREDRIVVKMSDLKKFQVFEPREVVPGALQREGVRSVRTVNLLNKQTKFKVEAQALEEQLRRVQNELSAAQSSLKPTDAERVLIQQGVVDGVRPEIVEAYQRVAQLVESRDLIEAQHARKMFELQALDEQAVRSQQSLYALQAEAEHELATVQRMHDEAQAEAIKAWADFERSITLPTEGIARRKHDSFREFSDIFADSLRGKVSGRRLSQQGLDDLVDRIEAFHARNRATFPQGFQQAYGNFLNGLERALPNMGDKATLRLVGSSYSGAVQNIDPDAWRHGLGGFIRRVIGGTGFKNRDVEGVAATILNNEQVASLVADINYHGYKLETARLVDDLLDRAAQIPENAWAQNIKALSHPEDRLHAYIGRAARPIDSKPWKTLFETLPGVTEAEKREIYDTLRDSMITAGVRPNLFDWDKVEGVATSAIREWGNQFKGLQDLAENKGLVMQLMQQKYRQYRPTGRILPPLGSDAPAIQLKPGERNEFTDLLEIMRNAENDMKTVRPFLSDMLVPKRNWENTLPANLIRKVALKDGYRHISKWLKDPSQVSKLERGEMINRGEFISSEYADDYGKLHEMLHGIQGQWAGLESMSNFAQRVAQSTLMSDLSFGTIQLPLALSVSPATGGKAAVELGKHAFTDIGFHSWALDNWDKILYRVQNGMGIGREAIFGQAIDGNIWQRIPGLKKAGNLVQTWDNIAFGRMQLMNKMRYIDTLEADVQSLRAVGKEIGQQYVDDIPVLKDLHNAQDIWLSTNEELERAFIRLANDAVGGVPRSQTLLGRRRQAVESTLLMVPGFFRARSGLINQATRALRNPHSPEGWLAASILAREAAFRLTFAAGIAAVTGTLPDFQEEVKSWEAFDPRRSGGQLTGPLGDGGYLGFTWGNQAPKLYAQMLLGLQAGEFNLNPRDRLMAIQQFFEGRQNPAISTAIDQIRGSDFLGRPLKTPQERIANIMGGTTPIWIGELAQTAVEQHAKDGRIDPTSLAAQTGLDVLGLNFRPHRPYDILNNKFKAWQLQAFPAEQPLDWRDAPSHFQRLAKEADPDLVKAEEDWVYDLNRRSDSQDLQIDNAFKGADQFNANLDDKVAEIGARVNAGQMSLEEWRNEYGSVQEDRADAAEILQKTLASMGLDIEERAKRKQDILINGKPPVVAQVLANYYAIKPQDFLKQETRYTEGGPILDQDIDWRAFKEAREALLDELPEGVGTMVREYLEPEDPIAQRLTEARADLDTYWDTLPKYRGLSVEQGRYLDFVTSSLRAIEGELKAGGVQADRQSLYRLGIRQLQEQGYIQNQSQAQLAALAFRMAQDGQFALKLRNPASLQWLVEHPDMMRFFSWMNSEIPNRMQRLLPPDLTQANVSGIQERELRGTPLASIQ